MSTEPTQLQQLARHVLDIQDLSIALPDDMDPHDVVDKIKIVVKALEVATAKEAILTAILGRLHAVARNNPLVVKAAGCKSLKEFESTVLTARSRPSLWRASTVYAEFPNLTPEEYQLIGTPKLVVAAKHAKGRNLSPKQLADITDRAQGPETVSQFASLLRQEVPGGNPGYASILIEGNADQIEELRSLMGDKEYQRVAGTNTQIGMLLAWGHAFANEVNAQ